MENKIYYFDKKLLWFTLKLNAVLCLIMFLLSFNGDFHIGQLKAIAIWLLILFGLWFVGSGTSLNIINNIIYIKRMYIFKSNIYIPDIISIRKNTNYSGLITEVIATVKVGNKNKKIGLINKPGLSGESYKEIFETILKINPNIKIDMSITSDKY